MESCAAGEMSLEAVLEERYSASELRVLRAEAEGLRERLVSLAVRGRKRLRRRVTVGRTPLGECLRQLEQTRRQWEAKARGEGPLKGQEAQVTLLNLLEKGLALVERVEALRERKSRRNQRRRKKKEKGGEGQGQDPGGGERSGDSAARDGAGTRHSQGEEEEEDPGEEEGHHETNREEGDTHQGDGDSGGRNGGGDPDEDGDGEEDKGAARDGPGTKYRKEKEAEEKPGEEEGDHETNSEEGDTHEGDGDFSWSSGGEDPDEDGDGEEDKGAARDGPGTKYRKEKEAEEDPGEEEGDHETNSEGSDTHEGEEDSSGNSGGEDPDGDEDQEDSFSEDSDEEEDNNAQCDSLWEKLDKLEQKMGSLQDPLQEKVEPLANELERLRLEYSDICLYIETTLMKMMRYLWSVLWRTSLKAVTDLQGAFSQFSAVEVAALNAEPDSLQGFLQAAQGQDTLKKLSDIDRSLNDLQDLPVVMTGPSCSDLLKKVNAIKGEVDSWCFVLLPVLLKEGQEKTTALQEKVDAVQGISPEQAGALRVKMGALQKQMGHLKEVMVLLAMAYKLFRNFVLGHREKNIFWKNAYGLVVTLKVRLKAVPQEEGSLLWEKVAVLESTLHDIPMKKLVVLEEKRNVCIRKVNVLQNKIWEPLEEELKFLKEKLHSLGDISPREMDKLREELDKLQKDLDFLQRYSHLTFQRIKMTTLQKQMNDLHRKMDALHKADASLEVDDEAKSAGGCSGRTGNLSDSVAPPVSYSCSGSRNAWHREVTPEERGLLIQNFAKTISPDNDSEAAKKILEAYARQIEEEVYSVADSKTEYHHLMAKKLNAMNRKLDDTLRSPSSNHGIRRNEQPPLQGPWIQPPGVTSLAATTGKAQPPELPRGTATSTESIQMPYTVNHPVQITNMGSVSMQGRVPGAILTNSLNMVRPHNSQLSHSPINQPSVPWYEYSASSLVGIPTAQIPLGMVPLLPTPVSSLEFQSTPFPDTLQGQSTPSRQASSGSNSSNLNAVPDSTIAHASANPMDLSTTHSDSSGSWPVGCAPHSAAQKRPLSELQAADNPSKALEMQEPTRPQRMDSQQPEEAMSADSSGESLAGCEPALTEGAGSEPPRKKQKMNPTGGTQELSLTQELFAVLQKHVSLTINQSMEKVGGMVRRLHGTALKDTEEAKALMAALEKALALLRFLFKYA